MRALGHVFKYGDNVDTDVIIPARYLNSFDAQELASHAMADIDPEFVDKVQPGDIIVANKNFGCGSSREQAPEIIKALGIKCVIAKSFARIFFRNSINNGLLLIEQPNLYDYMTEGDRITVTVNHHVDYEGRQYPIASLPQNLVDIINAGGLVKAMRKLNGLDEGDCNGEYNH